MLKAEIIAIGSELLTPSRQDTNSLWLTDKLNEYGIHVWQKHIIGDNRKELSDLLKQAMDRSDFVLTSGGLGPTFDDISREAFADALDAELVYHDKIYDYIRKELRKRDVEPTENNRRQGNVPEGCDYVLNPVGTAPGIIYKNENVRVALLPGPPKELKGVFKRMAKKLFSNLDQTPVHTKVFKMITIPERRAEEKLRSIELPDNAEWSILASLGQVEAHLRITSSDTSEVEEITRKFETELTDCIGQRFFGYDEESIESLVAGLLSDNGHTIAVAESCTAGWLGKRLTDVSGSSEYMAGGIISYSNEVKESLLNVEKSALEKLGAVSREVALQMARGVKNALATEIGVSITGVAGPSGGTEEKPVGTVYIAVSGPGDKEMCHRFHFLGDRDSVRFMSTQSALDMIRVVYTGKEYESAYVKE
jgi:nicotinamide-nucleotide amidase